MPFIDMVSAAFLIIDDELVYEAKLQLYYFESSRLTALPNAVREPEDQ